MQCPSCGYDNREGSRFCGECGERLGDQNAQDVLHIHNAIIREQVAAHQGFEVKNQGDGFMLAFSSARRTLDCAIVIQQTLAAPHQEDASEPIRVRIALRV